MTWPISTLGEVCEIVSGATPKTNNPIFWDGDVPWVTPKDLSGITQKCINDTQRKITEAGLHSCSARMLPANSVLFSSRAPIGLVAINTIPLCTNQGFKSMVPKNDQMSPDYLYWWLKVHREELQEKGRGATFKEVSKKIVEELQIPLPPLAEQKRIAGILDAADALRAKRRESIAQLDALLQSTFMQMFGDPVTNSMRWQENRLGSICDVRSSKRVFVNELVETGVPFYRGTEIGQLGDGQVVEPSLFIRKEHYERLKAQSGVPCIGDLLLPSICPDGRIYSVPDNEPFYFKDGRVLWIKVDSSSVNSIFLRHHLKQLFVANYSRIASGTTFAELKIFALKDLIVQMPPIGEQKNFAAIVAAIEQQQTLLSTQLTELDALFAALQHRAFAGEL